MLFADETMFAEVCVVSCRVAGVEMLRCGVLLFVATLNECMSNSSLR